MTDEYFENDYVNQIGEEEANKTILLRKVDFANTYCETSSELIANMCEKTDASDVEFNSLAVVFSSFGALLTQRLFDGD